MLMRFSSQLLPDLDQKDPAPAHMMSGTLGVMNLAVVAAFTAAGLSLVNVAVSARLSSRGARDQWRREQAQPLVAKLLNLSADAVVEWRDLAALKPKQLEAINAGLGREQAKPLLDEISAHWGKSQELYLAMREQAARLDLLSSRAVRNAAWHLVGKHLETGNHMLAAGPRAVFTESHAKLILRWHERLINATRQDFGVDTVRYVFWRNFVAIFGRHKPIRKKDPKAESAMKAKYGAKLEVAASGEEPA
jgi:hypothetical protein